MSKRKPIDKDFVVRFLNAIGRGKIGFDGKQEVLLNKFSFQTFSTEWEGFRMVLGVELGKIAKVVSLSRSTAHRTQADWWDCNSLGKRDKNPWVLCSDAARVKINDCLREDNGVIIKVEKKWIITYNGVQAGQRLARGTIKLSKANQMSFPDEVTKFHNTEDSANKASEKLRTYLAAYEDKKRKTKK